MAPIKVVLSGHGKIERRPELAVVTVEVECTSSDQVTVSAQVRETVQDIQAQIRPLASLQHANYADPSPVVEAAIKQWSSSSMSTRSYMQYEQPHTYAVKPSRGLFGGGGEQFVDAPSEHKETPRKVYEASVRITATFRDFNKLSDFTTSMSMVSLASVRNVRWMLADETQQRLRTDAIKLSYKDALSKARAFAEAMEKTTVRPVQIKQDDEADYGRHQPALFGASSRRRRAGSNDDDEEEQRLAYVPENVSSEAACEVTFEIE